MEKKNCKVVGQSIRKKDAMQLLLGKPSFMDDLVPSDALVVKILRSPHANAIVENIDTTAAKKIPGVVEVLTWEDAPKNRFTIAGQTYPEISPYDRLIIDRHVRFVGDVVAIIAAENEKAAHRAMKAVKVDYKVLPAVLDMHTAIDNPAVVHDEDDWTVAIPTGGEPKRNLISKGQRGHGDVDKVLAECDIVLDRVFHTKPCQQAMMEPFCAYTELDSHGRLHVVSSTQIVFHARRILAHALGLPISRVRVEKPRIGGGFGAKQTAVCEIYPALVTMKTGRRAKLIYTREECQIAGSPRHEMELHLRLGASKDGTIRAMDLYTLSNTGAYGEHAPTTVSLSSTKSMSLYASSLEAFRFSYDVVYTNLQSAGAYRGFGATQGTFAVESTVNELAEMLGMDPTALREKNMTRQGVTMHTYDPVQPATTCALDRCMARCREIFDWDNRYPVRDMGNGKVRAAGVAMGMQGSAIGGIDVGSATVILSDDGTYNLLIGAADMGTGCDTTLAQIAAETLKCPVDDIAVRGADTDYSPYDSGSYASSTAFITGNAVIKACEELKEKICSVAAGMMGCSAEDAVFEGDKVTCGDKSVSLFDISYKAQSFSNCALSVTASSSCPNSPPPFMVGMAEVEVDKLTGEVKVLNYAAVVDCGRPINPAIARIQTEGGIAQGIGMALLEDVTYDAKGRPMEDSFMQYRIPTRQDVGHLQVEFENSYEDLGPYGVKSIGEIVINTPSPAIAHAIYRATGAWQRELPITPQKVAMSIK